jgi:hemerythrin-like domain-containing protein
MAHVNTVSCVLREEEMKPIGLLMREHRLIEHMIALMNLQLSEINKTGKDDPEFIQAAVDFIRTYADRTHHGKEEDILFKELTTKQLSPEHKRIMDELVEEHALARRLTANLVSARGNYMQGSEQALKEIIHYMQELTKLYPGHIEKEDKRFFYPCMEYFSKQEQDNMLRAFYEFDQKMIHEKYQKVVEELEKAARQP